MSDTLKAVLIGCGGRGGQHIEAYKYLEGIKVTACCAPTPIHREPLAKKYGINAYDSAEKMLEKEKPDIVHILTNPINRYDVMKLVSDAGIPICSVEKPIAMAVDDWERLIELEKQSKTLFGICHQFRWHPDLIKCREALATFGVVKVVNMSCGMTMAGQGTHAINYGRLLAGDPMIKTVFANASGWDVSDPRYAGPETMEAYIVFDNGARGVLASGAMAPRFGDPAVVWQHVHVEAFAEKGWAEQSEFGSWRIKGEGKDAIGDYGGMETWAHNNDLSQAGFYKAMLDWKKTGREPGTSLRVSLHEWAAVLAMYQSILTGKPIDLDGFQPQSALLLNLEKAMAG
jgi:predicted dehydrogenase